MAVMYKDLREFIALVEELGALRTFGKLGDFITRDQLVFECPLEGADL